MRWCKYSWLLSTLVSFCTVCIALISSICVCFPAMQCFHSDLRSVAKSIYPLWCADGNNLQENAFLSFAQYVFIWEVQLVCGKVQSKTICEHTANPAEAALHWYCSPSWPSAGPLEASLMWREGVAWPLRGRKRAACLYSPSCSAAGYQSLQHPSGPH